MILCLTAIFRNLWAFPAMNCSDPWNQRRQWPILPRKLTQDYTVEARIISKRLKIDHISPVLRELHWLPVEHRISYKILLLTYKALNGHAPQYLVVLISKYVRPRPLRAENQYPLNSPRWRLETFGKRAFSKAALTLWNPLPPAWSEFHLLTLSRLDLKPTCSTKHFDSLYV